MLYRAQMPFDVITEAAIGRGEASPYDVLILSTCACLSDETCDAIKGYVEAGGNLIVTGDTSLFDETGRRREDFGLAGVMGVCCEDRWYGLRDYNYFIPGDPHPLMEEIRLDLLPAPDYALAVKPTTAAVLGTFLEPAPGRYVDLRGPATPAVTLNRAGDGRVLYLAGTFAEFYHRFETKEFRQLVHRFCLDHSPPLIEVAGAPASLEVVVRQKRGLVLVHLINYTGGMARPIERTVPLSDLQVTLHPGAAVETIRLLATDRDIPFESDDGAVRVTVPHLDAYEVVRVAIG